MPDSGYYEIHSDSGTIYDDGGPTGNYSTRVNSVVTIYPSTPGSYIKVSGQYFLENSYKSILKFYSGDTNSTNQITYRSEDGCVTIRSTTGPITIRFFADTETPDSGFQFNIYTCSDIPSNISINNITDTTAEISWSEKDTATNWIVEYNKGYFGIGSGIKIATNTNFIKLDSLIRCAGYYFYIYSDCDTITNNCSYYTNENYNYFSTLNNNSIAPYNLTYDISCNDIEISWQERDTNTIWVSTAFNYYNYTTDTIISNTPYANFDSLVSGTYHSIKVCPLNTTNEDCDCYRVWDYTKCCCPAPNNLYEIDVQTNFATIGWDSDTNSQGWIVGYKLKTYPDDSLIFITVNTNQVTINNLTPVRPYEVRVYSLCDSLRYYCHKMIDINTDISGIDNCITFTNLRDTNFSPKLGTYSNPNQYNELRDYGYQNQYSRHTVHYDTTEVDSRTDSLLHTVPSGEEASVRLGNWLPGGEGESFTYAYDVDTNIFDLMYLRYAVVMENPGHTMTNQPRFTLEILNENNTLIDPVCGYANFYASDSLGWNSVANSTVIWKDWTLVGFDITPYHGQRILVRLTTRDCDEGGHFGYAYYHLKCGSKKLISTKCGIVDSNTFIAPIGFNYKWYSSASTSTVLSTNRILDAVVDSTVNYHCLVSSTENPSCTFLYTAYGGYRFPLSQLTYNYSWSPCQYTVNFKNLSTISADGITPAGTNETCETSLWIFPDGDTIRSTNAVKTFSDTSEVKVRLISGIANDECISILDTVLKLNRPYDPLEILGDTSLCLLENTILRLNYASENFYWSTTDTTASIYITPLVDTKYYVEVIDSLGCYNIDSINIYVHPMDTTNIYAKICDNGNYAENGFNTNIAGIHEQKLISQWNCDSVVYLNLIVNPTFLSDTIDAITCDNNPYTEHEIYADSSGVYISNLQSIYGCDSIYIVRLQVNPTFFDTIRADIYKGNVYNLHGFNEKETGVYSRELQTYLGCDSVVYLDLQVDNIFFPNVVTANGDGINDIFEIKNLIEQNAFPENELIIFNRQGKQIYTYKDIKSKSDFWNPGSECPTGTYYFKFWGKRNDKNLEYSGTIEVLR